MKIAIIGDGGWGTANALLLAGYGHDVTVWGRSADHVAEIVRTHRNDLDLPGVEMPIAETVYRVCHEGLHVADAIAALMNRGLKSE